MTLKRESGFSALRLLDDDILNNDKENCKEMKGQSSRVPEEPKTLRRLSTDKRKQTPGKVKQTPDKVKTSPEKNCTRTDKSSTKSEKSSIKSVPERRSATEKVSIKATATNPGAKSSPSNSVVNKGSAIPAEATPVIKKSSREKALSSSTKATHKNAVTPMTKIKVKEETSKGTPSVNCKKYHTETEEPRIRRSRVARKQIIESSDEEEEEETKNKFFPTKGKEKSLQKKKEREEKRRRKYSDDEDFIPEEPKSPSEHKFKSSSDGSGSKKRRRVSTSEERKEDFESSSTDDVPKKPKIRKVERRMVPILEKLSPEELLESNTYQKFSRILDNIFDITENVDLKTKLDDDTDIPQEALLANYQLKELREEAAKLKMRNSMELVPPERLVRLMIILERNIWDGTRISPIADADEDEEMWMELVMERVFRAAEASLTVLYILTSKHMSKRVYLDDVIERTVMFTKFQLSNTIYPCFDPVYRISSKTKDAVHHTSLKRKRGHAKEARPPEIVRLYNRLHEIVSLLADLLDIQVLTDITLLQISTLGVAPFFVENVNELQLSALKLVTAVFSKYDKHRRLVLDDILASIARLPSSKSSLRTYHLEETGENIQMLTALVLQLIQCVTAFPKHLMRKEEKVAKDGEKTVVTKMVDKEAFIITSYEVAVVTAANFLTMFLKKCGSKTEEIDFRPIFENFIQDLLSTVNKPQWPAAELLLSLLGKLLVSKFSNKGVDISLRVTSIDYLGVIASRLRKDSVTATKKIERIDELIGEIKAKDIEQGLPESENSIGDEEEERSEYLQRILLDYLAIHAQDEPALGNTRHFYLAQWYKEAENDIWRYKLPQNNESKTPKKKKKKKATPRGKRGKADVTSEEESEEEPEVKEIDKPENEALKAEVMRLTDIRKQFLLSKIRPFDMVPGVAARSMQTDLDFDSAELISQYLASKRPFSRYFDVYLKHIINVLSENAIAVRTKAMKCLTQVVESDPSVLSRTDMQMGVNRSFLDHSTSVREAAVDLIGKFVLSRPELLHQYYDMISRRILDTGVSVRKRVIKIMREICMECPGFEKIPEMCVKMIRRVSDEEGIRKLVMEVFQNMWFVPIKDKEILIKRVMNITDVVSACEHIGLDWFEQLLQSLFKPKQDKDNACKLVTEPPKALLNSCKDIVKCLVDHIMRIEEESLKKNEEDGDSNKTTQSLPTSQRIVACMTTLYLFAKIRPQLLVPYAITLQPYLSLKCQTSGDFQIISNVARTLELVVPLIEHPSETFLAQLEEDAVKLILQHDKNVVMSCLSCLGSVINNVTKNYKLTRDCFKKYYGHLLEYKKLHRIDPENPKLGQFKVFFKRAVFTVGLLLRYFDFTKEEILCGLPLTTVAEVLGLLLYFMEQPNEDWNKSALQAIGFISIRHYDVMLNQDVHLLYTELLKDPATPTPIKTQVLLNLEIYLQEEELKMIRQDQEWAKLSKEQNLKEMGDVSSGMASTVIQLYLKPLLNSFLNPHVDVRWRAMQVINLVLQQGLVHPVQIVPYLICMSTDPETSVAHGADKQLQELDKKYPGFVHMKALQGIKLSYALQRILQDDKVVRGYRTKTAGELPIAMNGFLYTLMRSTRQQRRAIVKSILKQFDEQSKNSLAQLVYFADNLAYLPYQVQDEILFIVHQIDIMISVTGSNLLQSFKESLAASESRQTDWVDDDDDDMESILERLPENITPLEECIKASQGCLLLLNLKQHLKDMFGVTDNKISQYGPADSSKVYERPITKRTSIKFNPREVLTKLKAEKEKNSEWTVEEKRQLIDDYLGFKNLMLKIDSDNEEDDDNDVSYNPRQAAPVPMEIPGGDAPQENHNPALPNQSPEKVDEQQKRIPKLCIVPPKPPKPHRTEHKRSRVRSEREKRRHKKKKNKQRRHSDSESSEEEYSDPEFIV